MSRRWTTAILCTILCLGLTGCNSEYKAAVADYEETVKTAEAKNLELDTATAEADTLIADKPTALDETLLPALETANTSAKAEKYDIGEMPVKTEEINAKVSEMQAIDYTAVLQDLATAKEALEKSVAQYKQVDNPPESFVIGRLTTVEHVMDISAATENNDPNGHLGKAGGYTAQIYFSSDWVDQDDVYGDTIIEKGTQCGGSIEVYSTVEDAEKREEYLANFDGSVLASGSHAVIGTVLVRTSDELPASKQKELEASIIEALTTLE